MSLFHCWHSWQLNTLDLNSSTIQLLLITHVSLWMSSFELLDWLFEKWNPENSLSRPHYSTFRTPHSTLPWQDILLQKSDLSVTWHVAQTYFFICCVLFGSRVKDALQIIHRRSIALGASCIWVFITAWNSPMKSICVSCINTAMDVCYEK